MKLTYKFLLLFLFITLSILMVGFFSVNKSKEILQDSIGKNSVMLARATIDKIDEKIFNRAEELQVYTKSLILQEVIQKSNKEFEKLDNIQNYINEKDRAWTSVPKEAVTFFMKQLVNSDSSKQLREMTRFYKERYYYNVFPEIFVTNKYGANIAQTGKTTDYRQDDEQWWQTAKEAGVYITDIGYDKSAGVYSINICLRIDDKVGNFLGVMKAVFNIKGIVHVIKESEDNSKYKTANFELLTRAGNVIYDTSTFEFLKNVPEEKLAYFTHEYDDYTIFKKTGKEEKLIVHAHSSGYKSFKGLKWILILEYETNELFAPVYQLQKDLLAAFLVVIMFAALLGFLGSRYIVKSIRKLQEVAIKIGKGDLDTSVIIRSNDEIGHLSRAFAEMTRELKQKTTSVDNLNEEITERKLAEEKLARRTGELARSNAELQQFAYIASHDLQEPLRMVTSYVQLLAQRYKDRLDTDANEFIHFAVDGTERMQRLINGLLMYSRVESRGKPFTLTDCETVLKHVLINLQTSIEENKAVITHDPLPKVVTDDIQLSQLFQNLIGNAVKFHGKDAPRVHVSAGNDGDKWVFSVRDNGIGIEEKYKEKIFQIFQRLHSRSEYSGTGIGLAVCKKIVERHGGQIWIDSESGKGTVFYFTVPINKANKGKNEEKVKAAL